MLGRHINMIKGFPKIFHLGDKRTENIFDDPVEVTEKIDGSQFNFGAVNGVLYMRSKGAEVHLNDNNKMFRQAAEFATKCFEDGKLPEGVVFHGEYLQRPKHNTLAYSRIPRNHFALYGVTFPDGPLGSWNELAEWAEDLDCDLVPLIYQGNVNKGKLTELQNTVNKESYFGGALREGFVVKNYHKDLLVGGQYIPIMMCKYVSEQFKEKHKINWKEANPSPLERIAASYTAEGRWIKAIQRRRELGELEGTPRDIGPLLKYINEDILEEEEDNIKDMLWKEFRKDIMRLAVKGFPEWYKKQLMENVNVTTS